MRGATGPGQGGSSTVSEGVLGGSGLGGGVVGGGGWVSIPFASGGSP